MPMIRMGRRCDCWCQCRYRAARRWQSGRCNPCSVNIHEPQPTDPDRGVNGPRIAQARPPAGKAW